MVRRVHRRSICRRIHIPPPATFVQTRSSLRLRARICRRKRARIRRRRSSRHVFRPQHRFQYFLVVAKLCPVTTSRGHHSKLSRPRPIRAVEVFLVRHDQVFLRDHPPVFRSQFVLLLFEERGGVVSVVATVHRLLLVKVEERKNISQKRKSLSPILVEF